MTLESAKPLSADIGLGCYFWLALCALLSGALYPTLEVGTACQIPLTLSCDAGLLLGFTGCLAVAQSGGRTFGASSLAGTDCTSGAVVLPFLQPARRAPPSCCGRGCSSKMQRYP